MKTNQLMARKIGDYEVFQRTKDGMFNAKLSYRLGIKLQERKRK